MNERQATPDLLGVLMSGKTKEENNKAIQPDLQKAVKLEDNKTIKQPIDSPKEKATFNLSKDLLEDLEANWSQLRRELGSKQVSKTLIVETSLKITLEEYATKGQESQLYCLIASNKHQVTE